MLQFLERLVPISSVIIQHWSEERFVKAGGAAKMPDPDQAAEDSRVVACAPLIRGISAVIKDKFFWAYSRLLVVLGAMLSFMSGWAGGCPCHDGVRRDCGSWEARRARIVGSMQVPGPYAAPSQTGCFVQALLAHDSCAMVCSLFV